MILIFVATLQLHIIPNLLLKHLKELINLKLLEEDSIQI